MGAAVGTAVGAAVFTGVSGVVYLKYTLNHLRHPLTWYTHVMTHVRLIKPISLSVTLFLFQSSAPLHAEDKEDKEGKARGGGGGRRASHPEVHITKDLKRTCLYVFV